MSSLCFAKSEWLLLLASVIGLSAVGTALHNSTQSSFHEVAVSSDQFKLAATVHGSPNAPWRVVEFMDYECPPCKRVEDISRVLCDQLPDKLQWSVLMFPLTMHHHARLLAGVALVAKQKGCSAELHQLLFAHQYDPIEKRLQLSAKLLKVTPDWLSERAAVATQNELQIQMMIARTLNVEGTPTMFLISPRGRVWSFDSAKQLISFVADHSNT